MDVFAAFPTAAQPLLTYHQALLRGPSPLTESQRELIAAYVSSLNACGYCHGVHQATAEAMGVEEGLVSSLIEDLDGAAVDPGLRQILKYVKKLTESPERMTREDAEAVFQAGWDERALHDAVSVCALFNFMNRFVQGLGVAAGPEYFQQAAKRISGSGYAAGTFADPKPSSS